MTEEIGYEVENSKNSALYLEDRMGQELRTASIAIQNSLPADYHDISNEQLKKLAEKVMVSHITLLAAVGDDIIGVRSSDADEVNMSTKDWGFWYTSFKQLLSQQPVTTTPPTASGPAPAPPPPIPLANSTGPAPDAASRPRRRTRATIHPAARRRIRPRWIPAPHVRGRSQAR